MNMLLSALICLVVFTASSAMAEKCRFEILVQTGNIRDAGTNARITLQVSAKSGPTRFIKNLVSWGEMGAGHNYFEQGNLDRFGGLGPCMPSEPCNMLLVSDGSGHNPDWYVDSVVVSQFGQGSMPSTMHKWEVDQWLAIDEPPYELYAQRTDCHMAATEDMKSELEHIAI